MTPYVTVRISESARKYIDDVKAKHRISISAQIRSMIRRRMIAEGILKTTNPKSHSRHLRPKEIVSMNDEIRQLIDAGKIVTAQ